MLLDHVASLSRLTGLDIGELRSQLSLSSRGRLLSPGWTTLAHRSNPKTAESSYVNVGFPGCTLVASGMSDHTTCSADAADNSTLGAICVHTCHLAFQFFSESSLKANPLRNTPYTLLQHAGLSILRCAHADLGDELVPAIEGSALLTLRDLEVLRLDGWPVYFKPRAASSGGNGDAALALTELNTSSWLHEDHNVLLHAALRGGATLALMYLGKLRRAWRWIPAVNLFLWLLLAQTSAVSRRQHSRRPLLDDIDCPCISLLLSESISVQLQTRATSAKA